MDTGAVSQGVVEKDLNLDVGRRIAQSLIARGFKVRLTLEDDHFISLEERVRTGNGQAGAVFVSIHFNDASGDGPRGDESRQRDRDVLFGEQGDVRFGGRLDVGVAFRRGGQRPTRWRRAMWNSGRRVRGHRWRGRFRVLS